MTDGSSRKRSHGHAGKPGAKQRGSSQRWLARQRKDPFARQAADEGLVSRAHFKLQQLDERLDLVRPGFEVLELGAAPGGWTSYLESKLQTRLRGGLLVACDARPLQARAGTVVIEGLFGEAAVDAAIEVALDGRKVDLVLSDMAPNITGVRATDQARVMALADLALDAAQRWLKPGGSLVVKLFQGEGVDTWMMDLRKVFARARLMKPKASRPESREIYAVGRQFLVTG